MAREGTLRERIAAITKVSELEDLVRLSRDRWGVTYLLIRKAREEELWRSSGAMNFSVWMANLAKKSGMHSSELWKRYGAGKAYEGYVRREAAAGRVRPAVEDLTASSNTLALAFRVAGKEKPLLADELVTDVLDGKLTRNELNEAWKSVREAKAVSVAEKKKPEEKKNPPPADFYRKSDFKLASVLALATNGGAILTGASHARKTRWKVLPAPGTVLPDTASGPDVEIIENRSTGGSSLVLHGISVDHRHPSAFFVPKEGTELQAGPYDYQWLAVRAGYGEAGKEYVRSFLPGWGLLEVSPETRKVKVILAASKRKPEPDARLAALERFLLTVLEPAP
ncbi:MAG: hypothetical protein MR009_02235 [Sutterellaceae bacterium]|nr:hypothetical protein [Sutterellaceae bacterium]MDD7441375.1 hypothetical protein [Sutterellaceae bacterium]MDY2867477.1 hypothetical protein [Mesosutterella sp.]